MIERKEDSDCALNELTFSMCTFPSFSHSCFLYSEMVSSTSAHILSKTGLFFSSFLVELRYTLFPAMYSLRMESKSPFATSFVSFLGRSKSKLLLEISDKKLSISVALSIPSNTGFNIIVDEVLAFAMDSLRAVKFAERLLMEYSL
ncbi:hypothetical protein OGATHE_000246 [Ogataea polymorpha]|uniref:Uncharacterized protein n=1 Tax=Ogataea polymorpha TaxID=460523 RepID=A0A9P8THL1_9ASCO|nr:hypothetical protein OGATHE_000246 [Ogataea polymorpha]